MTKYDVIDNVTKRLFIIGVVALFIFKDKIIPSEKKEKTK